MSPILITGFHRSGTSAVAKAFHEGGLDLGSELLGAEFANPYGHFEDEPAIEVHDEILRGEGLTWKSPTRLSRRERALADIDHYIARRETSRRWGV